MSWLTGWKYRKRTTVPVNAGAAASFQIPVTVYYGAGADASGVVYLNGKCNADFSDIRVTDETGVTIQDIWQQSKVDGDNAVYWVEVRAAINVQAADLYVYYGNGGAQSASNIDNTFVDVIGGVVGAWTMNEANVADPVADYSGNGNNGTATGTTIVASPFHTGLNAKSFDGASFIDVPVVNLNDNLTVVLALKPTDTQSNFTGLIASATNNAWSIFAHPSGTSCRFAVSKFGVGNYFFADDAARMVALNQSAIISITLSGTSAELFINGVSKETIVIAAASASGARIVGGKLPNWNCFKGVLGEATLFNTVLSDPEILTISTNYPDVGLLPGSVLARKYASTTQPAFTYWGLEEQEPPTTFPKGVRRAQKGYERQRKRAAHQKAVLGVVVDYLELRQRRNRLLN